VIQDGGSLTKVGVGTLTLSGANTYTGLTTINAGKLMVDGSIMSAVTVNNGGTVGGSGTTGSITVNSGGRVAPGGSQILHVNGAYTQNAGGVLKIAVAGVDPSASGRLDTTGSATVAGTLEVRFVNGFLPVSGQVIKVLNVGGAFTGSFAQIIFPDLRAGFQFQAEFLNGSYQITALNDGVAATGFLNISTRMRVGTGDNALIGGFIVTGNPSATSSGPSGASKKVIIRAIGPSLASLPGRLTDPTLELRDSAGGLIFSNDNWMDSPQAQQIMDSGIPPSNDLEAAIVATLAAGSYTAVMRGAGNTTGIGVVEVYDLAQEVSARLANISSRGLVETGDNVMIGGFIAGNQAMQVLVRAIGPSLTQFGIANALADPTLQLHNSNGAVIAFNNDWQETDAAAIAATGIPPPHIKESAIVATLAPGPYTAIVRGLNDTSGVALVEVYRLQ
jgi:autotransporter-associated beta strand protein